MTFPSSPNNGDLHTAFGRRLRYKASTSTWDVVSSPSVAIETEAPVANTAVSSSSDLPLTGNEIGAMSYSQDTNTLYVWNGTGWFKIALVNTNPTITDGGQATYELNSDGTPTVITLVANDPEGIPITWSYVVSSGSLEDTTVTNEGAVFTITPGEIAATFDLTFTASDGVNIDTSVSTFSLSFEANWAASTQQAKIQPNDPVAQGFGYSVIDSAVSISGDYAIVGAPSEDTGGTNAGAAYIFTRDGTTWTQQAKIQASDAKAGLIFGSAVAIDGDTVVVGADNGHPTLSYAGALYVFTRSGTTWTQQAKLVASDAIASDVLGSSGVSISGDTIAVGARGRDEYGNDSGAVYVFTRSGTTWTQQAKLLNPDAANTANANDNLGISVDIDSDTIVAGAPGAEVKGALYVYTRSGTTWTQQARIESTDLGSQDQFGVSVSISGDTIVAGANREDTGGNNAGAAYIFTRDGTAWTQQAKIQASAASASAEFGISTAIDGDIVIVGAANENIDGSVAGGAYIFARDGTTWTQQARIVSTDLQAGHRFGNSVAIDVDSLTTIVAARGAQAVYTFVAG